MSKRLLALLKDARDSATMRLANFSDLTSPGVKIAETEVTDFIKERTRLYRETWIISRLDEAIATLEKKVEKKIKKRIRVTCVINPPRS